MDKYGNMTRKEACYFLGIKENASEEQIKRAYRYKVKLYHPDANPDMDTKEYYIKVQKAYEYLINNPYVPDSTMTTMTSGDAVTGAPVSYNVNARQHSNISGVRPAKVYSSTAATRASYQKQKDKEKEIVKIQKWDAEYKNNKRYQQQTQLYGREYADRTTGTGKSEEERILEKIRAIWLAETIKRQIAQDKEHKETIQRRKLYKAFMQQEIQDEGVERKSKPAKD
ncbi:MAG: DnaJ domain-containing protein [Lachnospiraceae bacterium]|nr:DnaJ domain-containing protein [Lachnospiraceae bacterium]